MLKTCTFKKRCTRCGGKHHVAICRKENEGDHNAKDSLADTKSKDVLEVKTKQGDTASCSVVTRGSILLQSALVTVRSHSRSKKARLLFDSGSQRTFISKKLATYLDCRPIGEETLAVSSFGSTEAKVCSFQLVTLRLIAEEENIQIDALVSSTIAAPVSVKLTEDWQNIPELQGLELADRINGEELLNFDIIIGNDHYASLITGEVIKTEGLLAMKSKFGWLLSGRTEGEGVTEESVCFTIGASPTADESLDIMLQRFWEIDSLGIVENEDNEDEVMKQFQDSIRFDQSCGRYTARLPWKQQLKNVPSNYRLSKGRLYNLVQRLRKIGRIKEYDEVLQRQLEGGIIEKVDEPEKSTDIVMYLPHLAVMKNDHPTTKLRVVYDASAKAEKSSTSLNDLLHAGPSLLPGIAAILVKFRVLEIGIIADIEKAFLQVVIAAEDRDATRFLWLKDITSGMTEDNLQHYRFQRVLFGATSSPFILNATLQHHLNLQPPDDLVAKDMKTSLYVDNLATSVDSEEESCHYYSRARTICNEAGFNLRQWMTNSPSLKRKIVEDDVASKEYIKVLGLHWESDGDILKIAVSKLADEISSVQNVLTKRNVCSLAAKIFDPLGLVEPFVVRVKMLLQEIWAAKLDWDSKLPADHEKEWLSWLKEVEQIQSIRIPRRLLAAPVAELQGMQLHTFCDSSLKAYGAVTYLRTSSQDHHSVSLVMAKSRISPMKKKTIPRMELLSAVVAVRLHKSVVKMLHVVEKPIEMIFWSDSQIVLHWIKSRKCPDQFIRRRVDEIVSSSDAGGWRYCPSKDNPADILSRGSSVNALKDDRLWYSGPVWLLRNECEWPVWNLPTKQMASAMEEAKPCKKSEEDVICCLIQKEEVSEVIAIEDFSSIKQLLKVTCMVLRFIKNCRADKNDRKDGHITAEEKSSALRFWLHHEQKRSFVEELATLESKRKRKGKTPTLVRQLRLFLDDDGIIRCLGRLHHAAISKEAMFPALLPKKSRFTRLMIDACHRRVLHGKTRETLTEFRQEYWTPQGRQVVKSTIRKCVTCLKADGPCYKLTDSPPLPPSRVTDGQPFQFAGVDYAGPLWVKSSRKEGVDYQKCYICLFTCAVVRAVHLEIVDGLTVGCFLLAFRRFISRRGIPEEIISDNAKNFKGAAKKLQQLSTKILSSAEAQQFLFNKGIRWNFIVERAPWWGGFYERMIGTVKRSLKKNVGTALLTKEELLTVIVEIEAVVNNRPLTYVYTELDDGISLTPSHFLCGRRLTTLPEISKRKESDPEFNPNIRAKDLKNRVDHTNACMTSFWRCWRDEYLLNLRECHQSNIQKKQGDSTAKVGDIVIIKAPSPRSSWKLGKIEKLLVGKDGAVRAAQVHQAGGQVLNRPLQHLYPLEIQDESLVSDAANNTTDAPTTYRRSTRNASRQATERIRTSANETAGGEDV